MPAPSYAKVASLNLGDGSARRKADYLTRLATIVGITVLGMQEASDRVRMLARWTRKIGPWRVWQPRVAGGAAVPIAWDSGVWRKLHARSVLAVARAWVGPRGAGPTFAKDKRINVVVLRHRRTKQVVAFLNTHPIPSVARGDLSPAEHQARVEHYSRHVAVIARLVRVYERVVLTLDANGVPNFRLLVPLHTVGLHGWTEEGTHGERPIDHVLTKGLDAGEPEVLEAPSDHGLVARVLTLPGRTRHWLRRWRRFHHRKG